MKLLKAIAVVILFVVNVSAMAQQEGKTLKTPEERAKLQLIAIQKECSLSNEQSVKVEKILLKTQKKLVILKESKPSQKGEKLNEIKMINDLQSAEMGKVLTPEQYSKYQSLLERQKERMRNRWMEKKNNQIDLTE